MLNYSYFLTYFPKNYSENAIFSCTVKTVALDLKSLN